MPYLEAAYGRDGNWGLFRDVLASGVSAAGLPEAVLDRVVISGPDEVAAGLEAVQRRLGATRVLMLTLAFGTEDKAEEMRACLEKQPPRNRGR